MIKLIDLLENKNKQVLQKIKSLGYRNPLNPRSYVHHKLPVAFEVSEFGGDVFLDSIHTWEKEQGYATQVLKQILQIVNRYGVNLKLTPEPFGNDGMSKSKLISWYKKHGFINDPDYIGALIYIPK